MGTELSTVDDLHELWLSASSRMPSPPPRQRALVVELVGPAGAGKTTLRHALARRATSPAAPVRVDRRRDLPRMAASALGLFPALAAEAAVGSTWSWPQVVQFVRLDALSGSVSRAAESAREHVVLDEGPVFALAKLRMDATRGALGRLEPRWHDALARWRQTLDAVVWVDAPDPLLIARIRARAKAHRAKHASDAELSDFLARYRDAYATVLSHLSLPGGPRVLSLRTELGPVETAAERLDGDLRALASAGRYAERAADAPAPRVPAWRGGAAVVPAS